MDIQYRRWAAAMIAVAAGAALMGAFAYVTAWQSDVALRGAPGVVLTSTRPDAWPLCRSALVLVAACMVVLLATAIVTEHLLQGRRFAAVAVPIAVVAAVAAYYVSRELSGQHATASAPAVELSSYSILLTMVPLLVVGAWLLHGGAATLRSEPDPSQFDGIWEAPSRELHLLPDGTFALLRTGGPDDGETVEGTWAAKRGTAAGQLRILLESDARTPLGAGWQLTELTVDHGGGEGHALLLRTNEGPSFVRCPADED